MTVEFYNQLAPFYRSLYPDWDADLKKQAVILDQVINEYYGGEVVTILDAACGIGTQAIGLAEMGYRVSGRDISGEAVELAKKEANLRGLEIDFSVGDMRDLDANLTEPFDLIIACDNAIPHLLSMKEILTTLKKIYRNIKPGGGCLVSVRDYSKIIRRSKETRIVPRRVQQIEGGRIILFDLWEIEGDYYQISIYMLEERAGEEPTISIARGGKYYCIETDQLEYLFLQAGFPKVVTLRDRYFQPLLIAKKD